jgi:hypothetical protein
MPKAGKSDWVVTLAPGHTSARVLPLLKKAGFEVQETLEAIGVITGRAARTSLPALRAIKGVADVSPPPPRAGVGPPDAEIS